jgi:RNA recognition motif-containing protein
VVGLDESTGSSKGYGFVTFADAESCNASIERMHKTVIEGRTINVRLVEERDPTESKGRDSNKVIVAGLTQTMTDDKLQLMCEEFGLVLKAAVVRNPTTGKSKGFGFVTFTNRACQQACIMKLDKRELGGGRVLNVRAVDTRQPDAGSNKEEGGEEGGDKPVNKKITFGDNDDNDAVEEGDDKKEGICIRFQMNKCHRGKACRWKHVKIPNFEKASKKELKEKRESEEKNGESSSSTTISKNSDTIKKGRKLETDVVESKSKIAKVVKPKQVKSMKVNGKMVVIDENDTEEDDDEDTEEDEEVAAVVATAGSKKTKHANDSDDSSDDSSSDNESAKGVIKREGVTVFDDDDDEEEEEDVAVQKSNILAFDEDEDDDDDEVAVQKNSNVVAFDDDDDDDEIVVQTNSNTVTFDDEEDEEDDDEEEDEVAVQKSNIVAFDDDDDDEVVVQKNSNVVAFDDDDDEIVVQTNSNTVTFDDEEEDEDEQVTKIDMERFKRSKNKPPTSGDYDSDLFDDDEEDDEAIGGGVTEVSSSSELKQESKNALSLLQSVFKDEKFTASEGHGHHENNVMAKKDKVGKMSSKKLKGGKK